LSRVIRSEIDVEGKIADILKKFVGQKFNDITISEVVRQYDRNLEGRRADIAVIKEDGKPLLLVETKKKYEARGFRAERRFVVTSDEVLGQVFAYAAILKRNGIYVPFVATANEYQIAVFEVPEDIDRQVDWRAVEEREYGRVLPKDYIYRVLRAKHFILHTQVRFAEDFLASILETITGIYAKKYRVEDRRQELHWVLIEDLRGFVDFLTPFVVDAIAPNNTYRGDIAGLVEDYARSRGYRPEPIQLAREMAYVLMNKIVFYKVLEHHYNFDRRLEPFYSKGVVKRVSEYLRKLNELFEYAVQKTNDFEAIFRTGIYDNIDIVENDEVLKTLDWLIDLIDSYRIEKFGDIVGYVYEDLIPAEERHELGEFYTPKPIAELIVKWAVRSPDDKILDPGCGSGTFLVEAYKRLAELKLKKPFGEIKHVPSEVHTQILDQLVGIDINEFPAHLTAINLAMRNPKASSSNINVIVADFFNIMPGQKVLMPYRIRTIKGETQAEIEIYNFDAVVGNPPYTRWSEIPELTLKAIYRCVGKILDEYDIAKGITSETGIYIPWIIHASRFLKENGRLGMIISNSWLNTEYGKQFANFLLDNFRIRAVIDFSQRLFKVPLIATCIILLEKKRKEEIPDNLTAFMYVRGEVSVDDLLRVVNNPQVYKDALRDKAIVHIYTQREIPRNKRWFELLFKTDDITAEIKQNSKTCRVGDYFDVRYGNILGVFERGGTGGDDFFYIGDDIVNEYSLHDFVKPLISDPKRAPYFIISRKVWRETSHGKPKSYVFICHAPLAGLPEKVRSYISRGAEMRNKRGSLLPETTASRMRTGRRGFYGWYDLGGIDNDVRIACVRRGWAWNRCLLIEDEIAIDGDSFLGLKPKKELSRTDLKAILSWLNSSWFQFLTESNAVIAGGGAGGLDKKSMEENYMIDIRKLDRDNVEKLAQLFDKLEEEAEKLGGADTVEAIYGSELARELTGKEVKAGIQGLFTTVIRDIDYEIAKILGLEDMVEVVRSLVLDMVKRRLVRAREARPSALRGSEEAVEPRRPRRGRRSGSEGGAGITRRLDEWL